jgi:MoxR-like ATPase
MKIERESAFIDLLTMEMNKVIVGQKHGRAFINWTLGQGHILLKVFLISKTLAIILSQAVHGSSAEYNLHRIYCLMLWDNDL